MPPQSDWWRYFHRSSERFGNDNSHWGAFCRREVEAAVRRILNDEITAAYESNGAREARSEVAIEADSKWAITFKSKMGSL